MFENSIMLAGLGGAVVPLVIHLLGRSRYRTVEWGAMMFIDDGAVRRRDPGQLRETLLLLVRMAAVGLLAVALARPVSGVVAGSAGETRVAAAIVIDCSGSMAYEEIGGARIEQARAAARQVLSTLRRGDRVAIVAAGAGAAGMPQLSGDLQSAASRVAEIEPVAGRANLAGAIEAAATALGRQDRVSRQLYVIADRQAANWNGIDDAFVANWRAHAPLARFAVIPVGGSETENVAVESIAVINAPAVAGCPGEVEIEIRNHGREPRTGMPLVLRLGGKEILHTTVNLAPAQTSRVVAPVTFSGAGSQVLAATIRGARNDLDDQREVVIDVRPPIPTLVVQGDPEGSRWIRAALSPFAAAGTRGADVAAVDEVPADQWEASGLEKYGVIVLENVPAPTPSQVAALEQFVYAGGGLLLAPGPASRTEQYNRLMYREEGGLLPALLQPVMVPPAPQAIERGSIDMSHPLTHFLAGQGGALSASIERFFAITARTADSLVLASFGGGDPFIMEAPYGRGRVVMMTCSLRPEWSTLPLTTLYLPLLQSTMRYLAGGASTERNVLPGAELVATFYPPIDALRAVVIRPDGSRDTCDVSAVEDRFEARYSRTDLAGIYTIRAGTRGAERSEMFAVAPPMQESDLTPLDEAGWAQLQEALGFSRMEPNGTPLAARLVGRRGGNEHWLAAVAGVLALLILELGLTRMWFAPHAQGAAA